jgi:hypothetical protein
MIGESCLQVDTLWGNFCWMAGDSQKCILIYSACFRYILSSLSSFWEICWDTGMLIYTVWVVVKNCNVPIWHRCYHAVFACNLTSYSRRAVTWTEYGLTEVIDWCYYFVCVGCFSRWTSVPPCERKMCEQELVLNRRHCRPWTSDRSP